MKRRQFLSAAFAACLGTALPVHAVADTITVYKSPT